MKLQINYELKTNSGKFNKENVYKMKLKICLCFIKYMLLLIGMSNAVSK